MGTDLGRMPTQSAAFVARVHTSLLHVQSNGDYSFHNNSYAHGSMLQPVHTFVHVPCWLIQYRHFRDEVIIHGCST
jgi:hypothetical protein